jgi:hypothetical protein
MTMLEAPTTTSTEAPRADHAELGRRIVAAVLVGVLGALLVAVGVWALTFVGSLSRNLIGVLNGHSLTSSGIFVLVVGIVLLLCAVGVLIGPKVNRWVALVARLVGIVIATVVALAGLSLVQYFHGWAIACTALGSLVVFALTTYERELHSPWPWAALRAWMAKIFTLNTTGINVPRGVALAGLLLMTDVIVVSQNLDQYFLSVAFGLLFVTLSDPGDRYLLRLSRMAAVGIVGALITALGFGLGGDAWGYVVLAVFVVTALTGLLINFDLHALVSGVLLNVWLVVTLSVAVGLPPRVTTHPWNQALAWLIGSGIAIVLVSIMWLLRGRGRQPSPLPEIPSDLPAIKLSRPIVAFVLIRAIAVSGAAAIAFGLGLTNADWMPLATLVAMKTTLRQSTLRGVQRLVGTALGAGIAAAFLVTVTSHRALEEIIIVLIGLAMSIYAVNYVFYAAGIAAAVLIALDLPHPTDLAAEGRRIFYTFAGIGIAIVVMVLAGFLQRRSTAASSSDDAAASSSSPRSQGERQFGVKARTTSSA